MKAPLSFALAVVLSASLAACSGDDGGGPTCTTPPIAITPGTWCTTITGSTNDCAGYVIPQPYTATFTQSGDVLTASSLGASYTGALCGSSGSMTGTAPGATVFVAIEFSDASHATGTSRWTNPACSGIDTFTAHSGWCP